MGGASIAEAPRGRRKHRPLTDLDIRVSSRWVETFLDDVGAAWNQVEPLEITLLAGDASGAMSIDSGRLRQNRRGTCRCHEWFSLPYSPSPRLPR